MDIQQKKDAVETLMHALRVRSLVKLIERLNSFGMTIKYPAFYRWMQRDDHPYTTLINNLVGNMNANDSNGKTDRKRS